MTRLVSAAAIAFFFAIAPANAGGEPYRLAERFEDVRLSVFCADQATECAVTIEGTVAADVLRSEALPFPANSDTVTTDAPLAWTIGSEEHATRAEATITSEGMLLIRQEVGFTHLNLAYTLLAPRGQRLETIKVWRTGAGPDRLHVSEQDGLFHIEHVSQTGVPSVEHWSIRYTTNALIRAERR